MYRDLTIKQGLSETIEFNLYATDGGPYSILPGDSGFMKIFADYELLVEVATIPATMVEDETYGTVEVPALLTAAFAEKRTILYWYIEVYVGGESERPLEGTLTVERPVLLPVPLDPVVDLARSLLRDFPRNFRSDHRSTGTSIPYQLPVINVNEIVVRAELDPGQLTTLSTSAYTLDRRNGFFTLNNPDDVPEDAQIVATGTHYQWVSEEDLRTYVRIPLSSYLKVEGEQRLVQLMRQDDAKHLLALAGVVETLWALLIEYSRDIDVNSPETSIPATQRYRQVQSMLVMAQDELEDREAILNIGLHRIQMFNLRRVSRTSNRYIPMYVAREFDDRSVLPTRVTAPIDAGGDIVEIEQTTLDNI